MEEFTNEGMDILTLAKEHNDKDAHWILILSFINDVQTGAPIEPESLEYIEYSLSRLLDGEDARTIFPSINDDGRKSNPGRKLEIARQVTRLLRNNVVRNLTEAYEVVGNEFHISPDAVRTAYRKFKSLAEGLEHYQYVPSRGRPRN